MIANIALTFAFEDIALRPQVIASAHEIFLPRIAEISFIGSTISFGLPRIVNAIMSSADAVMFIADAIIVIASKGFEKNRRNRAVLPACIN